MAERHPGWGSEEANWANTRAKHNEAHACTRSASTLSVFHGLCFMARSKASMAAGRGLVTHDRWSPCWLSHRSPHCAQWPPCTRPSARWGPVGRHTDHSVGLCAFGRSPVAFIGLYCFTAARPSGRIIKCLSCRVIRFIGKMWRKYYALVDLEEGCSYEVWIAANKEEYTH